MNPLGRLPSAAFWMAVALAPWSSVAAGFDQEQRVRIGGSVLKVEAIREQGGFSLGSGVVIAADRVVTSCHVTRDARSIAVIQGGLRWTAAAQTADIVHDLCLLQVPGLPADPLTIGSARGLKPGQQVTAIGYTGGMGLQSSTGDVVALHPMDGAPVIQSNNWFSSGASGGGLFDDNGHLVGILTFRMRGGEAHYFSAPVDWLDASAQAPASEVRPLGLSVLPFWQQPERAQPAFLQAETLARASRWSDLLALTQRWSDKDGHDAYTWYSRGLAEEGLSRDPEALRSFERSVAAEPRFASAWLRIGQVSLRLGAHDKARRALERLEPLSGELARQLASQITPASGR